MTKVQITVTLAQKHVDLIDGIAVQFEKNQSMALRAILDEYAKLKGIELKS